MRVKDLEIGARLKFGRRWFTIRRVENITICNQHLFETGAEEPSYMIVMELTSPTNVLWKGWQLHLYRGRLSGKIRKIGTWDDKHARFEKDIAFQPAKEPTRKLQGAR
jgi:hypothetical protein